jgi:hypothetical protein
MHEFYECDDGLYSGQTVYWNISLIKPGSNEMLVIQSFNFGDMDKRNKWFERH